MTKRNPLDAMLPQEPQSVVAMIPTARQEKRDAKTEEQKKKRQESRAAFDKANPSFAFFIPEHLHVEAKALRAQIRGLSRNEEKQINVTEINMTTSLLGWALRQVRAGKFQIKGAANAYRRKMTVIIEDTPETWEKHPFEIKPAEKKVAAKRLIFTYRLPVEMHEQIVKIAGSALPKGEILVRLLQYAVDAVKKDNATIKTSPMEVRQYATVVDKKKAGDTWA